MWLAVDGSDVPAVGGPASVCLQGKFSKTQLLSDVVPVQNPKTSMHRTDIFL